jgi:hypothetical protein
VLDGAVFAFVQGTDPESLLLFEACQGDESLEWQFAFVRRTSGELEGRHKGIEVWHADARPAQTDPQSTHFAITRALDPDLLEELPK